MLKTDDLPFTLENKPIKNLSMLRELRESESDRIIRLLANEQGMICVVKQSLGHIYATILELGFAKDYTAFPNLTTFLNIRDTQWPKGAIRNADDKSSIDTIIYVDELIYLAYTLKGYGAENIEEILRSILEGTNHRDIPERFSR